MKYLLIFLIAACNIQEPSSQRKENDIVGDTMLNYNLNLKDQFGCRYNVYEIDGMKFLKCIAADPVELSQFLTENGHELLVHSNITGVGQTLPGFDSEDFGLYNQTLPVAIEITDDYTKEQIDAMILGE